MAIYYVDPYLNASIGGIQGSNNPSARTGTWADPFDCFDVLNNTNGATTINGITLTSGDQLRFKGLANFDSFVYDKIRTTGSNYRRRNVPDAADQTKLQNWKTLIQSTIGNYRCPFFMSESDHTWLYDNISGTDIPQGLYMGQCANVTTPYNVFDAVNSSYWVLGGLWGAAQNTSAQLYIKLIHPQYVIRNTSNFIRFLSFNVTGLTISAGWTSETTQDGQTILCAMNNTANNMNFGYQNSASQVTYDLGRFHFFHGNTGNDNNNTMNRWFQNITTSTYSYIGTIATSNSNAWSYTYFNTGQSRQVRMKVGAIGDYYHQWEIRNNGNTNSEFWIGNIYSGLGQYLLVQEDTNTKFYIGNVFIYSNYSNNALLFYGTASFSSILRFLNNSYVYGHQSLEALTSNFVGTYSFPANLYNRDSAQLISLLPGVNTNSSSSGPRAGLLLEPSNYGIFSNTDIKAVTSVWYNAYLLNTIGASNSLSTDRYAQYNIDLGILDTEGSNYTDINPNIFLASRTYTYSDRWSDTNIHFGINSYDNKTIGTFIRSQQANPSIWTPLICYNNANNELIVQCNSNAVVGTTYHKKISLGYFNTTGKSNFNVGLQIEKNSAFSVTAPMVYMFYMNQSDVPAVQAFSASLSGNTYTFSMNRAIGSQMFSGKSHVGISIDVTNVGNHSNKYTIKNLTTTLT